MKAISLKRVLLAGSLAGVVLCWGAARSPAAEQSLQAPKAGSLEEQLEFLKNALVESFHTRDWKMLEMVAEGLKVVKLEGADLEIFMLRAERDAALGGASGGRLAILPWGLACRARLGVTAARQRLLKAASRDIPHVETPVGKNLTREQMAEAWRKYRAYTSALAERDAAMLAAALLGEKGMGDSALKALRVERRDVKDLVHAVLAADAEAGWKRLLDFCSGAAGEEVPWLNRVRVLTALGRLANSDRPLGHAAKLSVDGLVTAKLAEDAPAALRKVLIALTAGTPKDTDTRRLWELLNAARALPGFKQDAEAVAALKSLSGRLGDGAKHWDRMIDTYLKGNAAFKTMPKKTPRKKQKQNPGVERF